MGLRRLKFNRNHLSLIFIVNEVIELFIRECICVLSLPKEKKIFLVFNVKYWNNIINQSAPV